MFRWGNQRFWKADLPEACLSSWPVINMVSYSDDQLLYVSLFRLE